MQDNDVPDEVVNTEIAALTTEPEAPPAPEAPTLEALKAQLTAALATGNDPEMMRLSKLILKQKSDVEKVEATRLQAEAEAMAGDRQKLAARILKAVKTVVQTADLEVVKAKGFTFSLPNETSEIATVALTVPAIRKTGGGGGSTGALKTQTGLSRHEIIDQYASADEKAKVKAAQDGAASRPDSARYMAEKPVIKRILADNPHLIKR